MKFDKWLFLNSYSGGTFFIRSSLRILWATLINNPNDVKSEKSVVDTKIPSGKDHSNIREKESDLWGKLSGSVKN